MKPRPPVLHGASYRLPTPIGTSFITITRDGDGGPSEVFINIGKGGSDTTATAEGIGRLVSLILRMESSMTQEERAREIVDQLSDIGGSRLAWNGDEEIRSLPDAVAKALSMDLEEANE